MAHCSSLSAKARKVTGKFYKNNVLLRTYFKMEGRHEKSKHVTKLRGLCPIRDNAGAHKCKLVQDFLQKRKMWFCSLIRLIHQT